MMRCYTALLLAMALMTVGCPPPPPMEPDPPPPPYPEATCEDVCAHWRKLDCKEAEPTAGQGSCEAVCENVQGSGIIQWNLGCRASIESCAQVDSCEP
jgi:hypothetical protein